MGNIIAVNVSEKKGTQKKNVHSAKLIEDWGIENDAHAGKWHRQVSLLSYEKIEDFKAKGAPVDEGAFGENLIVRGIDLKHLPVGTRLQCGDVLLEVTQIGKQCHSGCEIYKIMGDCIMPREGIFTKVLKGGVISEGDEINVVKRPMRAAVLTSSDSGYAGEREDISGPAIQAMLEKNGYEVVHTILLPDDREMLSKEMARIADEYVAELLLTTGGTGFSPRDCMPEATMDIAERMVPGIPEAMRAYSMTITPRAMLSRAAACIRKNTLIINLPGSPKAVKESLGYILPSLQHGLEILTGEAANCARK